MANYLVTGAAGFIGAETCNQLLLEGHQVWGLDNVNDYYAVQLKEYRLSELKKYPTFHPVIADIENIQTLENLFSSVQFDAVLNLAARAGVRASIENPHIYVSTNAHGTLNLLEAMRTHNVKKMVLASTSSLYAGQKMPFVETLPVNTPISPYAASKKAAEVMAYTYHNLYELDISIVRYFTVFGPCGRPDMMPFRFINWIQNEKEIQLFGDGSAARDFTFVEDIARGTIAALKPLGYEIINLGGGQNPISVKSVITMMEEGLRKKAIINQLPAQDVDMKETWADISKAKELLNWEPLIDFETGLQSTMKWHQDHNTFLKDFC
jgi:UDP-glucuronate 4-epimerase